MLIESAGFPDVVLGARRFNDPWEVIQAILVARKEERPEHFVLALEKSLKPELYQVQYDSRENRVVIKSLDEAMKVGNEDEHLFKKALNDKLKT